MTALYVLALAVLIAAGATAVRVGEWLADQLIARAHRDQPDRLASVHPLHPEGDHRG